MSTNDNQVLNDYYFALERLVAGKPIRTAKNSRICNDSVSLEAGRGKGSIKKSREIFRELIVAIDEAALKQSKDESSANRKVADLKADLAACRKALDEALAREVSLLYEVFELKRKLADLTGSNVLPLRRNA